MSYIGSTPTTQSFIAGTDSFNGTGSATNFTLTRSVNSVNDIQVVVNNVVQYPPNYSVSGTTLTISPAPSAGTNNVYVRYLSTTLQSVAPVPGSTQQFASGTLANPSITFLNDTNTGIYSPAADTIAFVEGGTEAMRIDSAANVGIGTTVNNVFDQVAAARPLVVQKSDTSTTINGSTASITITNADTTTSNTSQINFAAITGASTNQYSSAIISAIHGARVNGQYPAGQLAFSTSSATNSAPTEKARIDSSGNLLVGRTNNPSGLSNGLYVTGTYSNTTPSGANVFINTDGSFFRSTSSLKYKTEVQDYSRGLEDVAKLRPVFYKAKSGISTEQQFAGFIAEEIEAAGLTEFVQYNKDNEPDALSYGNMVALCVKAIQEQQAMIDTMKQEIAELKAKVGT